MDDVRTADPAGALLLAISAAPDADHAPRADTLADRAWARFVDLAIEQRLAPLAARALAAAAIPAPHAARIDAAARDQLARSLASTLALARARAVLAAVGIEPIALKGVRLAHHDYPQARLRPMRDLDLLVPLADAERAQETLLAHPDYAPLAGAHFGIEHDHQLPTLIDQRLGVAIEVHHRLFSHGWAREPMLVAKVRTEAETIAVGQGRALVPSSHANVLHLVEHATLHHLFDNGPLTLADLHFATRPGAVEWPRLLAEADAMGLANAFRLVAATAHRHGAAWVPGALLDGAPIDADFLAQADAALLRPRAEREQMAFLRRLEQRTGTAAGPLAAVRAMLAPNPVSLAEIAGCDPADARRWLAYPVWAMRRGRQFLAVRGASAHITTASRQVRLLDWLGVDLHG